MFSDEEMKKAVKKGWNDPIISQLFQKIVDMDNKNDNKQKINAENQIKKE